MYKSRIEKVREYMSDEALDAVLITDGINMEYMSGFKGREGIILITEDDAILVTDGRYTEYVENNCKDYTCVDSKNLGYVKTVVNEIADRIYSGDSIYVGFEDKTISYAMYSRFNEVFEEKEVIAELVRVGSLVENLRMVKTDDEIEKIAKAEAIGDLAFSEILQYIKPGVTEKEIALKLEMIMRENGASGLSFDTICASGKNSSMPHAIPTDKVFEAGDFVTMDFGCIYEGYCSDMTRTVSVGEPTEKMKLVYDTVLKAKTEAGKAIKPGAKCSDIDKIARDIIKDAGFGEYFTHSLGHSVGMFIHEEPRLSQLCDHILEVGETVTVEPGIYIPGEFGVRIEDLVVVTEEGSRNLATSKLDLICL